MKSARAAIVLLAAALPAAAKGGEPVGAPAREVPLPPVEMRLIEEGRWLPIDLATALALASAKNLDILEARARLAEARGLRNEALGHLVPEYTGSFTARRTDGRIQASFGDLADRTFNTFIPAGTAELGINPGRALFDALAAHRGFAAAEQDGEQVTQDVLAAVAREYYGVQEAQARIKIAEEALAAARELARVGRDRAAGGVGLKVDVLRADARVAADEARLAEARQALREASLRLALALRLEPAVMLFPTETVVRQRALIDAKLPLEALTRRAVDGRPDLAAELRRVAAAEDSHRAGWAGAVGPSLYGSFEESAIGRSLGDLGERKIYGGLIGLRLSPASIGHVQAASARVEQARLHEERLRQQVAADVIGAREEVLTAEERIAAAERGLRAAEAALELSQVRFQRGVGIGLEVLDAQAAASEARTNLVSAIVAYDGAQVGLLRAVGGVTAVALGGEPQAPGSNR